ncbi:MAG: rhomboid family intramembrane serine protease [Myxococcota bacterium]|nr:rhomboid family intramembrane serine protease [Myxococcota bacterium]
MGGEYVLLGSAMVNPWFLSLIQSWALDEKAQGNLLYFEPNDARFEFKDGSQLILLRAEPEMEEQFMERLKWLVAVHKQGALHVVLLGGEQSLREPLQELEMASAGRCRFYVYQLQESGELWVGARSEKTAMVGKTLTRLSAAEHVELPDPQWFQVEVKRQLLAAQSREKEMREFRTRLSQKRPLVTYVTTAVLVLAFLAEWYFGGTERPDVLARMGANVPSRVLEGEWWRLLSSAFLHSGLLHMACNGYVLVALGTFVEQLLGSSRLAVILVLSAVGGSLASVLSHTAPMSVGASGALWGLFGAAGALAFWPRGVIPQALVPRLKRSVMVNLGINLLISFAPRIDMAAHLGGGLVGGLLLGSGVLLWGRKEGVVGSPRESAGLRAMALALSVVALLAFGLALQAGKPWALNQPWSWHQVEVGTSGFSLEAPDIFSGEDRSGSEGAVQVVYGDFLFDEVLLGVVPMQEAIPLELFERQRASILQGRQSATLPQGAVWEEEPRALKPGELGSRAGIYERFRLNNGVEVQTLIVLSDSWGVTLEWVGREAGARHREGLFRAGRSLTRSALGAQGVP